jgi:hypothetical protein
MAILWVMGSPSHFDFDIKKEMAGSPQCSGNWLPPLRLFRPDPFAGRIVIAIYLKSAGT